MVEQARYIHALRYRWLNAVYDPVVALAARDGHARQQILRLIPGTAEAILDVASGTGTLSRAIGRALPGAQVQGVDGDAEMVKRARHLAVEQGVAVTYAQGLAQALPYDNASFDVVTACLLFHHLTLDNKRSALREISRVLRPGGMLLLSDWGKPHNWLSQVAFLAVRCLDGFGTTRENVEGRLPAVVEEAGFVNVRIASEFMAPLGTIALIQASNTENDPGQ